MSPTEDRIAFEALVRRHHGDVYRAAYGLLGRGDEAEDVTQQLFLKVLERRLKLDDAREPAHVLQWFARRMALERLRGESRRKRREEDAAMVRNEARSEGATIDDDERRRLWSEVARLPRELRETVLLRFQEGRDFAAIGDALACSAPTAHARLGRALERLRRRLSRGGIMVAAARLETILAVRAHPHSVPASLEAKLLGLAGAKTAALSASSLLLGLGLATAAAVMGWVVFTTPPERVPTPSLAARGDVESREAGAAAAPAVDGGSAPRGVTTVPFSGTPPEAGPTAAPPLTSPQDEKQLETATIVGSVLGPDGKLVPEVIVSAVSEERQGKIAAHVAMARSDELGRFRLEVPALPGGQHYHLEFKGEGIVPRRSEVFPVVPKAVVERRDERIERDDFERPGAFRVTLRLLDPEGRGVPKASVGLHRVQRRERGEELRHETGGITDERGVLVLHGQHLGRKLLRIDARSLGFNDLERRIEMPLASGEELVLTLDRGLSITGTIATTEGPADGSIHLHLRSTERWLFANRGPDGRFTLPGLEPGAYDVHVGGGDWSPFTVRGVRAGTDGLRITVKRYEDLRDHGDHDGEIHGHLHEAETGALLRAGAFDTEIDRVETADRATLLREILPSLVPEFVGQRSADLRTVSDPGFHHVGLAPGIFVVSARRRGCAPAFSEAITVPERGLVSGIRLSLGPGAAFEGCVVDADGQPVPGAYVVLTWEGERAAKRIADIDAELAKAEGKSTEFFSGFARAGADGCFRYRCLPTGLGLRFAALDRGHLPGAAVAVELVDGRTTSGVILRAGPRR